LQLNFCGDGRLRATSIVRVSHLSDVTFFLKKNYTSGGFRKVTAPPALQKLLSDFWETNKDKAVDEEWDAGNIHTNHWEIPTKFVDVSDDELVGGGESLMEAIWNVAKKEVEDWTGMKVRPSSLYGIRVYTEGSILNSHVDRLPLISSCIVNVAQDGKLMRSRLIRMKAHHF
jgi:hypothetical protein